MATVLIVEDEGPVQELLKVTLTPQHQVVPAGDPAQAIELVRLIKPDLVLLDLNLQAIMMACKCAGPYGKTRTRLYPGCRL